MQIKSNWKDFGSYNVIRQHEHQSGIRGTKYRYETGNAFKTQSNKLSLKEMKMNMNS